MAIVNATFDTQTKEFKVTIDGNELSDVEYMSVYNDDEASLNIELIRADIDGFNVYTRLNASQNTSSEYASADKTLVDTNDDLNLAVKSIIGNL